MTDQQVVPEGWQWVIYRSGKFSRLADPGRLKLRKDETVGQHIDTRNEQRGFTLQQLYWHDTPFNCEVSFRYRTDLVRAARGDLQRVAELAQFNDVDRHSQATTILRDVIRRRLMEIDRAADGRRFPLVPGSLECQHLLAAVCDEVIQPLLDIGIIVDQQWPMTVEWLDETLDIQDRGREEPVQYLDPFDSRDSQENETPQPTSVDADAASRWVDASYLLSVDDLKVLKPVPPYTQAHPPKG